MSRAKAWIEAMRLRTLPVSLAGVMTGGGCACFTREFTPLPFIICMLFAVMAQIVSNFANEYFDYRNGLDRKGREGFRRGVTEGDLSPTAMRNAVIGLLTATCAVGCSLIVWSGWWIIPIGIAIAVFALAYSAGPWPLSHHGLGEIAVVIFFGIVPVMLTARIVSGSWISAPLSAFLSLAIGLMGANVMIVNNFRDVDDDARVNKRTLAVIIGAKASRTLYIVNAFLALLLTVAVTFPVMAAWWMLGPLVYINISWLLWKRMGTARGHELNPVLGKTALLMFAFSIWMLTALACNSMEVL